MDGTLQAAATRAVSRTSNQQYLDRAIEATWLAAAFLIPATVAHQEFMLGFIQVIKVTVFRSLAILLLGLFIFDYALSVRRANSGEGGSNERSLASVVAWLRSTPMRWIVYGAVAVLIANLISLAFSPIKSIGIWGIDVGWDTYGLYNILGYLVFFTVIAAKMRTRDQVMRLIWTLTAVSILVSIYGVAQHFGIDPMKTAAAPVRRAGMSFGNPIFGPAFLNLTIPITAAAIIAYRTRMTASEHIVIGAGLIATQITAIMFSQSRGPLLALIVELAALAVVVGWVRRNDDRSSVPVADKVVMGVGLAATQVVAVLGVMGGSFVLAVLAESLAVAVVLVFLRGGTDIARLVSILVVAGLFTWVMIVLPVVNQEQGRDLGERVLDFGPSADGGARNRLVIWDTAWDVFSGQPWVDTEAYSTIPDLTAPLLRPLVGYGPDMFAYAYPMAGDTDYTNELASHGHNFIVHTVIELGLVGVAAYLLLLGSIGLVLYRLLMSAKKGEHPDWMTFVIVGLVAALMARVVEQLTGKAQVSDLQLMWVLAAVVGALAVMASNGTLVDAAEPQPSASRASRRERRRSPRRASSGAANSASPLHIAAASLIALMLLVLWWTSVASVFASHKMGADARKLPNVTEVLRTLASAADKAPASGLAKRNLAAVTFQSGLETPGLTSEQRLALYEEADALILETLDRNPMDQQSLARHADYLREIAKLDPSRVEEAVRAADTLAAIMPGFWQPKSSLALSLINFGMIDDSLGVIDLAKEQGAIDAGGAQFVYLLEAMAYEQEGNVPAAIEAAHCSIAHQPSSQASDLLARVGAPPGDTITLTDADLLRCPEMAR